MGNSSFKFIVVVDYSWEGHIPYYHKTFIKKFLEFNYNVVSISPACEEIIEWAKSLEENEISRIVAIPSIINPKGSNNSSSVIFYYVSIMLKYVLKLNKLGIPKTNWLVKELSTLFNWVKLNSLVNKCASIYQSKPEIVFLGYLDAEFMFQGITHKIIDQVFNFPWAGVYLGPSDFRTSIPIRKKNFIERYLPAYNILKSKNNLAIIVSDEGVISAMEKHFKKPIIYLPEIMDRSIPEEGSDLAKSILNMAGNRKIVSLLGVIAERKGVELLVDAANRLYEENVFFLFAGKLHKDSRSEFVLSKLSTLKSNCFTYMHEISGDKYFNELVQLSDVVFLAYKSFYHGSGILTKAAFFQKPVIATKGHCIGDRVEKYNLGLTIEEGSVEQCISSILSLTKDNFNLDKPNYDSYLKEHSDESLSTSLDSVSKIMKTGIK